MDDDDSPVYLWNHKQGDFADAEEVPSLVEFAGQVLQTHERVAKMLARRQGFFERLQDWWLGR